jgi:hypothetical protein
MEEILETKVLRALDESIAHWERLVKYASRIVKKYGENCPFSLGYMIRVYKEGPTGEFCSLCNLFGTRDCKGCPLKEIIGRCTPGGFEATQNNYHWVVRSKNFNEFVVRAEIFLDQLKRVQKEYVANLVEKSYNAKREQELDKDTDTLLYCEKRRIKEILETATNDRLIDIVSVIHGIMYRRLRNEIDNK